MIIKKGNPERLVCWRTLRDGENQLPMGSCCVAERCAAFMPALSVEERRVSDAEMARLFAADPGWTHVRVLEHVPPDGQRNILSRQSDFTEGECGALPFYCGESA